MCLQVTMINDCCGFNEPFSAVAVQELRCRRVCSSDDHVHQAVHSQVRAPPSLSD